MIQPAPTAPIGSVTHHSEFNITSFQPTDAILCRNKSPLITLAFRCLRSGIPVVVLGRDIGEEFTKIITKSKAESLRDLSAYVHTQRDHDLQRAKTESAADNITDKYSCIEELIANSTTVADVLRNIETLFSNKSNALTFATIHKAKGGEWPNVYILEWSLLPSKYAKAPWQKQQERNLQYVAVTRAQLNLNFITLDNTK